VPEVFAAIRPDDQSFALLLHLVGATVTFGALLTSATSLALARGDTRLLRLGYFSLLLVGLPGLILLRVAGGWLYSLQNWDDLPEEFDEPTWLGIGFIVADGGGLLFLLALALGGVGVYRLRNGKGGAGLLRVTMVIALILIVAYVVAVWAMTGKPN
jgi:Kef-type K+ transport system membrane component KefB